MQVREIPMLLQNKVLCEDFSVRNFHLWRTVRLEYQLASRRKGRGRKIHRLGSDDVFFELVFQRLPIDEAGNRFHEILLLHPEGALLAEGRHQGLEGMRVARSGFHLPQKTEAIDGTSPIDNPTVIAQLLEIVGYLVVRQVTDFAMMELADVVVDFGYIVVDGAKSRGREDVPRLQVVEAFAKPLFARHPVVSDFVGNRRGTVLGQDGIGVMIVSGEEGMPQAQARHLVADFLERIHHEGIAIVDGIVPKLLIAGIDLLKEILDVRPIELGMLKGSRHHVVGHAIEFESIDMQAPVTQDELVVEIRLGSDLRVEASIFVVHTEGREIGCMEPFHPLQIVLFALFMQVEVQPLYIEEILVGIGTEKFTGTVQLLVFQVVFHVILHLQRWSSFVIKLDFASRTVRLQDAVLPLEVLDTTEDVCLSAIADFAIMKGGAIGIGRCIEQRDMQMVGLPIEGIVHLDIHLLFLGRAGED